MYAEGVLIGGRYRLVRQIGEGGMASVWSAEHTALGSPVAVKFLHAQAAEDANSEMAQRFMREARAAASVRHRNVIEILDFGLTDEGVPYMVMEMLEGESLADRMERECPLPIPEATRLVALVLRGLSAVHDAGIVHRDLKPENIFLVQDADGTFPKLLDFGVSRQTGAMSETPKTNITQEGMLVGTPDYMSPEQARGLRDLDSRTDLYSMGVILYEALTGQLPFESENLGDLIVLITTHDPTPVAQLRPDVSPALSEVVGRAMHRDRDRRYQNARDMRTALLEATNTDRSFGERGSGLVSLSEAPPATAEAAGAAASGGGRQGNPPDAGREPTVRATPDQTPGGENVANLVGDASASASLPEQAESAGGSSRDAATRSPFRWLATVGLIALGAVTGILLYREYASVPATPKASASHAQPRSDPAQAQGVPWTPETQGVPLPLRDAGIPDAGRTVRVRLTSLPDAAQVEVEGVPVDSRVVELPASPHDYRIEVTLPDAGPVWRVSHPGRVGGAYEVSDMSPDELEATEPDNETQAPEGDAGTTLLPISR